MAVLLCSANTDVTHHWQLTLSGCSLRSPFFRHRRQLWICTTICCHKALNVIKLPFLIWEHFRWWKEQQTCRYPHMAQASSLPLKRQNISALEEVFISSGSRSRFHAATKHPWDQVARMQQPGSCTKFQHQSLVCSNLKADRSKIDLETSYNFLPCSLLWLTAHLHKDGLERVWAHKDPLASLVCLSLADTWQNQACKCSRAPSLASVRCHRVLLQPWLGAMLTVHSHFCGIIHSLSIFETMKSTIYCLLSFLGRHQGHLVRVREGSGFCPPPPAPHGQVAHRDLSYSREPRIRGAGAYFCQEVFAELRLTYWGKQQTLPDHINKPSLWASM